MTRTAYSAATPLPFLTFAAVRQAVGAYAREHELALQDGGSWISVATDYGTYRFAADGSRVQAGVTAPRADWHRMLKDNLADTLAVHAPETAAALQWSDADSSERHPANFQLLTVLSAAPLGAHFLRVTAQAQDLSRFDSSSIHFRLALPAPENTSPEWPAVTAAGLTRWPGGAKTLHRPVYTARSADPGTGILTFDVFLHEGGRTAAWAQAARPGQQFGLTGPGGGGVPAPDRIRIYSDETGFPAVARLLEQLPQAATGHAVLLAETPEAYDLPRHPGITVEWVARAGFPSLASRAIRALSQDPGHSIWLSAEKFQAQKLRAHCKAAGLDLKPHSIAAYWSLPDS